MKGFLTSPKNDTIDKFKKQMMAPIPTRVTFMCSDLTQILAINQESGYIELIYFPCTMTP